VSGRETELAVRVLPTPAPGVIVQRMDEGAVLFDGRSETYFGLNTVGAEVWALLPPVQRTVGAVCAQLSATYPDAPMATLLADVHALLDDLVAAGLATTEPAA
jgi:hypothetical protein